MRFISKSGGKAIQLAGESGDYSVELAAPSDTTTQAFLPVETALFDSGQYRLDNKSGDKSLEVTDASFFKLANIQAGVADESGTQAWFIRMNADGAVTIKNQRSGKPAEAASSASGANVRQNKSSGKNAQRWIVEECGDGWFRLRSATASGAYLDASTGTGAAGKSDVRAMTGAAGEAIDAQKWRFTPVKVVKAGPVMPKAAADAVEQEARKHLGKRYVFGTQGPTTFDCSGYIYYVLNESGVREMSRVTAQDIYDSCVKIPASAAKRGDIIFFKNTYKAGRTVTHLGFYLGNGKMIHAGSPVQISKVNTKYFKAHFYAYGRIA
jgi:cell wall-associated NlpC family hydrolase